MIQPNMLAIRRGRVGAILLLLVSINLACSRYSPDIGPRVDYTPLAEKLERFITHEMQDKALPALSVALVEDETIVWAKGFGMADAEKKILATAETVYRVGSVSKLFTDIAIMQLVESGEVDLDAPVTQYLAEFQPQHAFGKPITLRQLMSHRAGLVREPPVGNYFDDTAPTLAQTVQSLNSTALVYEPETRTKYSNAGIAVVGYVLERLKGKPFANYLKRAVLEPLGMHKSAFEPLPEITKDLAAANMWTYDGRIFEAPTFQLGVAPAGGMYSTVVDLGRFMIMLFKRGNSPGGKILKPESLETMWTPQFADSGQKSGFGIGFAISEFQGYRRLGHGGAIYGFATELAALPEPKLSVVAVTSMDAANAVVKRIADYALELMLAKRNNQPLPEIDLPDTVDSQLARRLAGRYRHDQQHIDLIERNGELFASQREFLLKLKSRRDTLIVDDRLSYGMKMFPAGDNLRLGDKIFSRTPILKPEAAPQRWQGLIGEYGWDHNTLYILEKGGQLHALIEWFFCYPLTEISPEAFAFPNYGLYHGEKLIFTRDQNGAATKVEAASVIFKRRHLAGEEGQTFRITPLQPVEELRALALAAQPPQVGDSLRQPDLVDLSTLDPTIKFDIRYATTNNFMGAVFYDQPKAFLQRPAAEALLRAHQNLKQQGYGLLIHDAYRPWYVTKMFWEATPESQRDFVANPSRGSRHNRGCAVDLTLYDLQTGAPIQMVSGYDEFSNRADPDYPGGTSRQRWHRDLLRRTMEAEGFRVYEYEWWHFDYKDWRQYPIQNFAFEEIPSR